MSMTDKAATSSERVTERVTEQDARPRRAKPLTLLPVVIFVALAGAFYFALQSGDPSKLPSALIGKRVPEFALPPVPELKEDGKPVPGFSSDDLARGKVSVVNVWASWCIPCFQEHPLLVELARRSGAPIYGMNYKDEPANARRFLGRLGNPFVAVGADRRGRVAIDWGVYGVPETFIVDGTGRIVYKHVGPIDARALEQKLLPIIARTRAGTPSALR